MNKKYVRTEIKKATFLEPKKMKTQWDIVKSDPRVKFIALMPIKKLEVSHIINLRKYL